MLSQLIKEAAKGKEVIIGRGNLPVVKLVPIRRRKPGTLRGVLKANPGAFDPLTTQELKTLGFE